MPAVVTHGLIAGHHRHAPLLEPRGHLVDFGLLCPLDLGGKVHDLRAGRTGLGQSRHHDRLLMMRDHHLGEHRIRCCRPRRA